MSDYSKSRLESNKIKQLVDFKKARNYYSKNPKIATMVFSGFRANTLDDNILVEHIQKKICVLPNFCKDNLEKLLNELIEYFPKNKELQNEDVDKIGKIILDNEYELDIYILLLSLLKDTKENFEELEDFILKVESYVLSEKVKILSTRNNSLKDEIEKLSNIPNSNAKNDNTEELICQINDLKSKLDTRDKTISEQEKKISELNNEWSSERNKKEKSEEKLELLKKNIDLYHPDKEYDHHSVCLVTSEINSKSHYIQRIADVIDGTIIPFKVDLSKEKKFDNRENIIYKDGPLEKNSVGVWFWSAEEKKNGAEGDFIKTSYDKKFPLIEIYRISQCNSINELLSVLNSGIEITFTTEKILFTYDCCEKNQNMVLCDKSYFEKVGSNYSLKENQYKLYQYSISSDDIVRLSNNKTYYRHIFLSSSTQLIISKSFNEIISSLLRNKISLSSIKELNLTKKDRELFRNIISLTKSSIKEEFIKITDFDDEKVQNILDDYIEHACEIFDENSLPNELVYTFAKNNSKVMDLCKDAIRDDWIVENNKLIIAENMKLKKIENEISNSSILLDDIKKQHKELLNKNESIQKEISKNQSIADNVLDLVEHKIKEANDKSVDFVANLSFVNALIQNNFAISSTNSNVDLKEQKNDFSRLSNYPFIRGKKIDYDESYVSKCKNDSEIVDSIADNLYFVGVLSEYSRYLAIYLYMSFLSNKKQPLLIIGPKADEIVDALSIAMFGKTADVLECGENFDNNVAQDCINLENSIIKISNPFSPSWISRLPSIVSYGKSLFVAVYPFSQDVQIEPKSLYNSFLPIMTEHLVDNKKSEDFNKLYVTTKTENFEHYQFIDKYKLRDDREIHELKKMLDNLHSTLILKENIGLLSFNIRKMVEGDKEIDFMKLDLLFSLFPYAYCTSQSTTLKNEIEQHTNKYHNYKEELLKIHKIYGADHAEV